MAWSMRVKIFSWISINEHHSQIFQSVCECVCVCVCVWVGACVIQILMYSKVSILREVSNMGEKWTHV